MTGHRLTTAALACIVLATAPAHAGTTSSAASAQRGAPAGLVFPAKVGRLQKDSQFWADRGQQYVVSYSTGSGAANTIDVVIGVTPAVDPAAQGGGSTGNGDVSACRSEFERYFRSWQQPGLNPVPLEMSGSGRRARDASEASLTANFLYGSYVGADAAVGLIQQRIACRLDGEWSLNVLTRSGLYDSSAKDVEPFNDDVDRLMRAIAKASS